jgi:hypothetical protein
MTPSPRYNRPMRRVIPASILLLAAAFAVCAAAQANGVPASVMSYGPGRGMAPGVPASVTSLGPLGYTPQWNIQPLFPTGSFPAHRPPHHPNPGHNPGRGNQPFYGGLYYWGGGYGYYPPVVVTPAEEANDDEDGGGPTIFDRRGPRRPAGYYEERAEPAASKEVEPAHAVVETPAPPEPAVQPKTVLIFRDGHQEEVQNYAILGEHLIALGETRRKIELASLDLPATVKANDERGIDFTLPVSQKAR